MSSANLFQLRAKMVVELASSAKKMIKQQRLRTAKALYEEMLSRYPEHTAFISFNLGVLNQMAIGDGEEARRLFRLAIERCERDRLNAPSNIIDELEQIEANACENLMYNGPEKLDRKSRKKSPIITR